MGLVSRTDRQPDGKLTNLVTLHHPQPYRRRNGSVVIVKGAQGVAYLLDAATGNVLGRASSSGRDSLLGVAVL